MFIYSYIHLSWVWMSGTLCDFQLCSSCLGKVKATICDLPWKQANVVWSTSFISSRRIVCFGDIISLSVTPF